MKRVQDPKVNQPRCEPGPYRGVRSARLSIWFLVLLALVVRGVYVWFGSVEYPIRGDVNQYVLYAWNMTHRGTFSTALPDAPEAVPDSYRGPGYPAFLAAAMLLAGHADLPLRNGPDGRSVLGYESDTWMQIALAAQVVLGALTVWLVIALGRFWLPEWASLFAGAITAIWPHLVTFSGVMLSETLFAFLLTASLWLLCRALVSRRAWAMVWAGLGWGLAYLVNPIVALFPLVMAPLVYRRCGRAALLFLAAYALLPGVWAVRNALSSSGSGSLQRIEENFVQGSWPQFLVAYNTRLNNDISLRIVEAVDSEVRDTKASPVRGLQEVRDRISLDPGYYLRWYLLEKPFLLWDWHLRIGAGDIYFLPVSHSAFDRVPLLRAVATACRWSNAWLFWLAFGATIPVLLKAMAGRDAVAFGALSMALCGLYVTAVHVVLQAEPRYSIPYRPVEILLAATALAWIGANFPFGRVGGQIRGTKGDSSSIEHSTDV